MNFVKRRVLQTALAGLLFLSLAAGAFAQTGTAGRLGKITILPFSGGTEGEREGIPELLMITGEMMENFMVMPRTSMTDAAMQEINFQAMSGMTDADTIARLGAQFGADYIMAGSITSVGTRNLLIVSVVRIDVIRQVAGTYLIYDSLNELNRDEGILRRIAAELVAMTRETNESLEKLALLPVMFESGANREEGDALAQLLAIHFLRAGKYAVYPRTGTLEQVQEEYETQLRSGVTRSDEAVRAGAAVNPPYVLSVVSRKIGTETRFNATIISVEGGYTVEGDSELYANMGDGIAAMDFLARKLSGQKVTEQERRRRASAVSSEVRSQESEERSRAASEATDRFLRRSGIVLGGELVVGMGGTGSRDLSDDEKKNKPSSSSDSNSSTSEPSFMGGGIVELRLFRYLGIQTGVQFLKDWAPIEGGDKESVGISFVQLPILARLNLFFTEGSGFGIGIFGGIGINVAVTALSGATEGSPGNTSLIFGFDGILSFGALELFLGYQGNFGRGRVVPNNGPEFNYDHASHSMTMGLKYQIFFRR